MGSLSVTLIVFFVSLIVCHFIMCLIGKNTRFWKMSEYFWLFTAGLALVAATAEVTKLAARNTANMYEIRLDGKWISPSLSRPLQVVG